MNACFAVSGNLKRFGLGFLVAAAVSLGSFAASIETASAELLYRFKIHNWKGAAYTSQRTGRFSHCVAYTGYKSGISLYFFINTTAVWTMGFSKRDWNVAVGNKFPVRYQIDRGRIYNGTAVGATRTMARVKIPTSRKLFNEFRRGKILRVETPDKRILGFNLTDTNQMLRRLLACAIRNKRNESPDDNPFRKKGNNPFG